MNELELRIDLAAAYRLASHFGWDDLIYTHISAKIPNTDQYLINHYGMMFSEITASSLVKVNINGDVLDNGTINPAGFFVHKAVHTGRPDVGCVMHAHTNAGIAVSADKRGLLPVSQTSTVIIPHLGYHDYRGIVLDSEEEVLLQKSLGNKKYLMLRNHGLLTAGNTVSDAFCSMHQFQKACEIQTLTDLSNVNLISEDILISQQEKVSIFAHLTPPNPNKHLQWKALKRMLDKIDESYKY